LPSVILAQRWGLYKHSSYKESGTFSFSLKTFILPLLTWASECLQVHNPLPLTRTWGGATVNNRT
jgi:hypothetical protein